jgi:membrane associated rhomboid family serine protease
VITYVIIAITVAVSFYAWNNPSVMRAFIMNPYSINRKNEFHRLLTSGFIHNDHMHLMFNMFSFYFFGLAIEQNFAGIFGETQGGIYYVAMYLIAIIFSDFPSYMKHKNNPGYNSLGASGGVSAVVFAFIILQPLAGVCIFLIICPPGFIMGILFVAFSYYQGKKSNDNINHEAHLYGAFIGLIFCLVFYPASLPQFLEQISQWDLLQKIF